MYKNLNLNKNDLFLDVGSFQGKVISEINSIYNCEIIGLEPELNNFKYLNEKFKNFKNIRLYNFGLSNFSGFANMSTDYGLASLSLSKNNENSSIRVEIKNVIDFINNLNLKNISVLKLNVEGSEYEILNELIESGFIKNIKILFVQFHMIDHLSKSKRIDLIQKLRKTHSKEFSYYFVWEKWVII